MPESGTRWTGASSVDTCDELRLATITWIERRSRIAFIMAGLDELARDVAAYVDDQAPGCPVGRLRPANCRPGQGLLMTKAC